MSSQIQQIVQNLPEQPGVYQYYDSQGVLLYIGKAKNLKKRVSTYFSSTESKNAKLRALVSKINRIEYVVVNTESDALLLENNLIKQYQPKYNILLKDDKTYPWICIKNEPFPRLVVTRNYTRDGSIYFGPYTSGKMLHTLLALFRELFPLRTCNFPLSTSTIEAHKYKPCLELQIGNCLAPCVGAQTEADYLANVEMVKSILKGNTREVLRALSDSMHVAAKNLDFEQAHRLKLKYDTLSSYQSKTTIINQQINDIEVYTILNRDNIAVVNMLKLLNGAIVQSYTAQIKSQLDEKPEEMLAVAISEIRNRIELSSKHLIVNIMPDFKEQGVVYSQPTRGEKKHLMELSLRNCFAYYSEILKREDAKNPMRKQERILTTLMKDLHLKHLPTHIECFDNSNLQGTNPVAACVVFKNAQPSKRDYRHFIIKSVEGPDDYASMKEVVYRRYHRLLEENQPIPQLIVIDGGKGQLGVAMESIRELGLDEQVALIGIAERLEEIYFAGDSVPLFLDKKSESLKLIQHIRDEAHRFGVKHHTSRRSKAQLHSELIDIKGIGAKTVEQLFVKFKSVDAMKLATIEELASVVGAHRATIVFQHFRKTQG